MSQQSSFVDLLLPGGRVQDRPVILMELQDMTRHGDQPYATLMSINEAVLGRSVVRSIELGSKNWGL